MNARLPGSGLVLAMCAVVLLLLGGEASSFAAASGSADAGLLPPDGFSDGWVKDGKVETFVPETLYEHINGEAELYLPYGFEGLTSAYYRGGADGKTGLTVDLYRMGSLLEAFGIYSNYRSPENETVSVGAEGDVSGYHLTFYQDRYFVRMAASSGTPDRKVFLAAAEAVARNLPGPPACPKELDLLAFPDVASHSEKFVAESVLGYKFFPRGLTAEASLGGKPVKLFVVLAGSVASAGIVFDRYVEDLKQSGITPLEGQAGGDALMVRDPLYRGVLLRRSGPNLFGIAKLEDPQTGLPLLERWLASLPR